MLEYGGRRADFVADQLFDGRRFRALTVVDNFSRKCLGIYPDKSIKGEDVVSFIKHVTCLNKARPNRIQVDNGSEHSMSDSSQKPWINGPTIIKSC